MLFQAFLIASRLTPNLLEVWKCFWGERRRSQRSGTCEHFNPLLYWLECWRFPRRRSERVTLGVTEPLILCLIQDLVYSAIHPAAVCHSWPVLQLKFNKAALLLWVFRQTWLRFPVLLWCLQWQCTPCVKRGGKTVKRGHRRRLVSETRYFFISLPSFLQSFIIFFL